MDNEAVAEDEVTAADKPYEPFPTFANWALTPFKTKDLDFYFERLENLKSSYSKDDISEMMTQVLKWAVVDTGAIEGLYQVDRGFTFNVAVNSQAWSKIHETRGAPAARSIDDAMNAYGTVIDAVTHKVEISELWIKELHSEICASQETYSVFSPSGEERQVPFEKGKYKVNPNSPKKLETGKTHNYASPLDTPMEMDRLIKQLRSEEFQNAHPVLQATYAHYAYVCIHPFPDGNGRVSRALASVYLYRKASFPLVIFSDQSGNYLDALELADEGDPHRFNEFISFCVIDTIRTIETRIKKGAKPKLAEQIKSVAKALIGRAGMQHLEIDSLANRLLAEFRNAYENQSKANPLPTPYAINFNQSNGQPTGAIPDKYRHVRSSSQVLQVSIQSGLPANVAVFRQYGVVVAHPEVEGPDFLIVSEGRMLQEVYVRDLAPTVSESLRVLLNEEAEGEFQLLLGDVANRVTVEMTKLGYSPP